MDAKSLCNYNTATGTAPDSAISHQYGTILRAQPTPVAADSTPTGEMNPGKAETARNKEASGKEATGSPTLKRGSRSP